MSFTASSRAGVAIKFLLHKGVPEYGVIFEEVSEQELQLGDIVLFAFQLSNQNLSSIFGHAGVYCWDGEVIHFQNNGTSGEISKVGFKVMKEERGKCQIWRKKDGINESEFRRKVREAMNSKASYSLGMNNCIHFALHLLGLLDFYSQLVETHNEGGSCSGWSWSCSVL